MENKTIFAENLKRQMDLHKKTRKDICNALGFSYYTFSDWVNGKKYPRMDKVELLANYFGILKSDLIEEKTDEVHRMQETNDAIADITLTLHKKPALVPKVKAYIKAGCPETQMKLAAKAEKLNDAGMEELVEYSEYLGSRKEYCLSPGERRSFYPVGEPEAAPAGEIIYIRHYLTPAAAGYAAPIEGEDYELIPVTNSVPARADFCIDISGDSMAPYIEDGQRVYVQRDATLEPFDVGVFFVDGDVLCKQYCVDHMGTLYLLSANKKREDANRIITRESASTVVCFGKVILPRKLPRPTY